MKLTSLKFVPKPLLKFHCAFCGVGFTQEDELGKHEEEFHEIKCDACDYTVYTETDLKEHVKNQHSFTLLQEHLPLKL